MDHLLLSIKRDKFPSDFHPKKKKKHTLLVEINLTFLFVARLREMGIEMRIFMMISIVLCLCSAAVHAAQGNAVYYKPPYSRMSIFIRLIYKKAVTFHHLCDI